MSFGYHFQEAWRGMRRAPGVATAAGLSLLAAWVVMAGTSDALWNGWRFVQAAEARKEVLVLMKEHPETGADSILAARLRGLVEVEAVAYVSPDTAWARLSRELSVDQDLLASVGSNPLPPSWRLTLREHFRDVAHIQHLAGTIRQYPEVGDVVYGGEWLSHFEVWLSRFTLLGLLLATGIAVGVVVLVMLTIRLAILARRDVLRLLHLLGARPLFIVLPFLLEGMLLTFGTSLLALGVVEGASSLVAGRWGGWAHMPLWLDASLVLGATLLGLLGSVAGSAGLERPEGP